MVAAPLAAAQRKPVTADALLRPSTAPGAVTWAPDGRRFVYEQDRAVRLYDVASRSSRELILLPTLSAAAAAVPPEVPFAWQNRRVREQTVQWFPDGERLLIRAGGDLFLLRVSNGEWAQLTSTAETEHDPKLSPDGRRVSFRRANDLFVMDLESRAVTRLTRDGSETLFNGRLDWVYPEELDLGTAHWWSPDSTRIAYLQFDVSRQPVYPHADLLPLSPVYEPQRYPKAGEPNADVRLGVAPAAGGDTRWMDLGDPRQHLLARVDWHPAAQALFVQRLNRVQNRLDLLRADAGTGESRAVFTERAVHWINIGDSLRFLRKGAEFLWASERDGFRHLYRYSADGKQLARLTTGDWEVTDLAGVDEAAGEVYFVSTEASPLERQLYRVSLKGGARQRITKASGTHSISMGPDCAYFLGAHSSLSSPSRRVVFTSAGAEWAVFVEADQAVTALYDLRPVEIVEVKAADGALLYARLIRPAGFREGRKYPAVVVVYGGPHSQSVRNTWQGLSLDQVLAHRGFVVWQLDNRGSSGRGHKWESALYRSFGARELEDQQDGIRHLVGMGFVDESRLGVYGWSYGGYMTLYSLLNAPDLFRAGVAGAPVTDWRNYDTIYTERYLGLPAENAEGYRRSSPIHNARNLKAKLLLIHNFGDDNVLFQNTLQMADALQRAGRHFEMMIYPQKTHGVTGPARAHMAELIAAFFERALAP